MPEELLIKALELFTLTRPYTREQLDQQREQLLHTWDPRRFANLTNNPKKYMQAYKKAEEMTRLVEASYVLLSALLNPVEAPSDQRPSRIVSGKAPERPDDQDVMSRGRRERGD